MKKKSITMIAIVTIVCSAICAQTKEQVAVDDEKLIELENRAGQGDTAAMHRLIEFYDENSEYIIERELTEAEKLHYQNLGIENATDTAEIVVNELYTAKLEMWLNKGIAMNDPVALATMGMRMYYTDEANAIVYLSKAADEGNAQAALFCGSACLNQGKGDEAFNYLSVAYRLGAPSASWHLAMCYSAEIGTEPNREKAIEVMRHAALLNYPEAVSEMRRIEPGNKVWEHKADSLEIDFPDFPIIPDE